MSLFVPRYVAETAPPAIRGALGSVSQVFICSGILLSYLAGVPYIKNSHPHWAGTSWWRWMLLFPAAPALAQVRSAVRVHSTRHSARQSPGLALQSMAHGWLPDDRHTCFLLHAVSAAAVLPRKPNLAALAGATCRGTFSGAKTQHAGDRWL